MLFISLLLLLVFPLFSDEGIENEMLVGDLKGIVLIGDSALRLENIEGVHQVGLCIPGDSQVLFKRLHDLFIHKSVALEDISLIEETVTAYYKEQARPVVLFYMPEQELDCGVIHLVVQECAVGAVVACGAKWFSNEELGKYVRLKRGDCIDENTLLDDVAFINRNTFRRAEIIYYPDAESGSARIELVTKDRFPLQAYAGVDNTGLHPIGRNRWFAGFDWGKAFGLDHMLTYQYTSSFNSHKFQSATLDYTAPLSWRHVFKAYASSSRVNIKLKGRTMQASGRYMIPFYSSPFLFHEASCGYDFKRADNTADYSEEPVFGRFANISQFLVEYLLGYQKESHKTAFKTSLYFSPAKMVSDQTQLDFESLRPFARPKYVYGRLYLSQYVAMPREFSFVGTFRAQASSANLLPSEQCGLGGYDTVRGYEERVINRDNALLLNLEFRSPLLKGFEFLSFIDYGIGHNHKLVPGESYTTFLASMGPGIRYNFKSNISARLDWGIKLHRLPQDDLWSRLHFSIVAAY